MTTATRPSPSQRAWRPHRGPQTAFLASDADEVLYGGAAGGGKSEALLIGALVLIGAVAFVVGIDLLPTLNEAIELLQAALGF